MAGPTDFTKLALDFDGEYGKMYARNVRGGVAGYDVQLEMAACFLQCQQLPDNNILVIGPGWGEELPLFCKAQPSAKFTLIEPSEGMLEVCKKRFEKEGLSERMTLLNEAFSTSSVSDKSFGAVIMPNVLHCVGETDQEAILHAAAKRLMSGGSMIVSAHSEPQWASGTRKSDTCINVSLQRLGNLGVPEAKLTEMREREKLSGPVYNVDASMVATILEEEGCTKPEQLFKVLFGTLWIAFKSSASKD